MTLLRTKIARYQALLDAGTRTSLIERDIEDITELARPIQRLLRTARTKTCKQRVLEIVQAGRLSHESIRQRIFAERFAFCQGHIDQSIYALVRAGKLVRVYTDDLKPVYRLP